MTEKKNYYETLGIQYTASDREVKKAYRQLAKKYHPDHHPNNKEFEQKFREITDAYNTLSHKLRRAAYDQFMHFARHAPHHRKPSPGFTSRQVHPKQRERRQYPPRLLGRIIASTILISYAIILIFGNILLEPKMHVVLIPLFALIYLLARDTVQEFIEGGTPALWNFLWLGVTLVVFLMSYNTMYHAIPELSESMTGNGILSVIGLFRWLIFFYWMLAHSHWAHLLQASLFLCFLSLFKKRNRYSGWGLLAIQIAITTLMRYDPRVMFHFVYYYDSLFSIAPIIRHI